ncbi:hypothetical protein ACW2QC_09465 [Virgibacillus sp. FSP13]
MKLMINGKAPSWWIEEKPETIGEWWNDLDWKNYDIPDHFVSQGGGDVLGSNIIFQSDLTHNVFQFVSHRMSVAANGIVNEFINIFPF